MTQQNNLPQGLHTVERKIRFIAESLGSEVDYLFMNWAQANVEFDGIKNPTIIYILPPAGKLDFSWSRVKDRPDAEIAFVACTELDFDGDVNDGIIEAMKRLAIRFVLALNESGLFEPIAGELPYQVIYDKLDANVTGVVINLPLIEEDGVMICDDVVREEDEYGNGN